MAVVVAADSGGAAKEISLDADPEEAKGGPSVGMDEANAIPVALEAGIVPTTLSWRDLHFRVKKKHILKGVNGNSEPGRLCAIMGPSGAGKSTLLNCLAGRIRGGVTGRILVNGKAVDPVKFRRRIAYVMQEDALYATATVREALNFSAKLRLPASLTVAERKTVVDNMIEKLMLQKCQHTMVGNNIIRGVSGGEKKRTAIGVELISNPTVLFLDEPTSGLDSYAAHTVVKILEGLTKGGRTIITTIHQPSSEVFDIFDDVLLMADGSIVYHDTARAMTGHFAAVGKPCPQHYNPADFVMFLMQKADAEGRRQLIDAWETTDAAQQQLKDPAKGASLKATGMSTTAIGEGSTGQRVGCCTQMAWLGIRELRNVIRDKGALIANTGGTLFLFLVVAAVFYSGARYNDLGIASKKTMGGAVAADGSSNHSGIAVPCANVAEAAANPYAGPMSVDPAVSLKINNHFGSLVQVAIGAMFGLAQPMILGFPLQRPVFMREYATGTYNAVPYFLSKLMTELPTAIVSSLFIFLATYWLVGFRGNFIFLVLSTTMLGMVAASYALAIGSLASNVQVAVQFVPLLFVPQLLFAGLFIAIEDIPEWLRWAQYLCSLKYSINIVSTIEMQSPPVDLDPKITHEMYYQAVYGCPEVVDYQCKAGSQINPVALFPRIDVEPHLWYRDLAILGAIFFGFRLFSCIVLSLKASLA